jgi:hypothetical protein
MNFMTPAHAPFRTVLAIYLVSSLTQCGGDFTLEQFATAVKQQHAKNGQVSGEWVLEQWGKVEGGGVKAWIESMNAGVQLGFTKRTGDVIREGPDPPIEMSGPSNCTDADEDENGPNIDTTTGHTKNMDERGPLLVAEVIVRHVFCEITALPTCYCPESFINRFFFRSGSCSGPVWSSSPEQTQILQLSFELDLAHACWCRETERER